MMAIKQLFQQHFLCVIGYRVRLRRPF